MDNTMWQGGTSVLRGLLYSAILLLSACGGGGGGSTHGSSSAPVTYSISGNVMTGTGLAASGVSMTLTGGPAATPSTAATDSSGNYTFAGLAGNYTYTVTPSAAGSVFSPANRNVALGAAGVTAQNFTSAPASATIISGVVTGPWVDRVQITISGGATPVIVYTSASGSYSSPSLLGGVTYTVTPSLPGYSYTVAGGSGSSLNTAVSTSSANFTAASAIASSALSGSISYGGALAGRVYLKPTQWGSPGTSIALSGVPGAYTATAYQIRGIQPPCSTCAVSYTVNAFMDTLGTGVNNAADPQGTATVNFAAPGALTANITLNPPVIAAPATASIARVSPTDSGAVVNVNPVFTAINGSNVEAATGYLLEWATDTAFTANHGSATVKAHGCNCPFFMGGLTNGNSYYFRVTSQVTSGGVTTSSAPSAAFGPVAIGAAAGANTLSGAVSFTGAASGPLYVTVQNNGAIIAGVRYASPVTPAPYTIPGVPSGSYKVVAFIDMNNDGLINAGDLMAGNNAPTFTPITANTTLNIGLPGANAMAGVSTTHGTNGTAALNWYSTTTHVHFGTRMPVSAIVYSAPNVAVPLDLTTSMYDNSGVMDGQESMSTLTPPVAGDAYQVLVTYADGSTEYLNAAVNAVLGSFAQSPAPSGTATNGGASVVNPVFTWAAPLAPPAPYAYSMFVQQANGAGGTLYSTNGTVPDSVTSVTATGLTLTGGTAYNWWLNVVDSSGNMATLVTSDTP